MLTFFCLVSGSAWAQTFTQGDLKFTVIDADTKTVSVAKASNDITGAIVLPSTVTNEGVTYTVTMTAAGAFHGCTGITAMTVPASVTTIKRGFLTGCTELKNFTIKDSDTPLYFDNDYWTYTNGDEQLCVADLDYFYMGRDITMYYTKKNVVKAAKKIEVGGEMTVIPGWFSDENTALTEVTIGGNITKIGQEAFDSNTSLSKVTITAPVDTIYQSAFWGCSSLTAIELPATVKYLGPAVFRNCTALEAFTIPAATEQVDRGLLTGCSGLKNFTIEDSDTPLYFDNDYWTYTNGDEQLCVADLDYFYMGRDITKYNSNSVVVTAAKKIELGGKMTNIPNHFSDSNAALTELSIGGNITKIGLEAFDVNTSLSSVTITAPVDTIYQSAFWGCSSLTAIELPATVKYLAPAVFRNCTALEAFTIPAATEQVDRGLLTGCTSLKKLTVEDSETPLIFKNNFDTYNAGNNELFCAGELDEYYQGRDITVYSTNNIVVTSAKKIELGGGMTAIPTNFTKSDTLLTTLIIGDNITKIGASAFSSNTSLNSVTITAPIDTIYNNAFYGCAALPAFELPATTKYIAAAAFKNCAALEAITIPAATEQVDRGIFTGCSGLKSFTIEDSDTPLFFNNEFWTDNYGNYELCIADLDYYYQGRDVNRYSPDNKIVTAAKKIEVAGTTTVIPAYFTENNKALTEVSIHGNMTKIGQQAFNGCESLTSITVDAPIDTIYANAFLNCKTLPAIELPATTKYIAAAAFKNCAALEAITIPAATEQVDRGIFTGCSGLKSFTIEDSDTPLFFNNEFWTDNYGNYELCIADLDYYYQGRDVNRYSPDNKIVTAAKKIEVAGTTTVIPAYFTENNKALTEVSIHGNMTKIGSKAFNGCENLTSITFDAPIDTIYANAFLNCKALPAFELPATTKYIAAAAFKNCSALEAITIPAATEQVDRGIFTGCSGLKSFTIEDSDTPLYFNNEFWTDNNGNDELCVADLEELYVGRDINMYSAKRLVSTAQKLAFGQPVTTLGATLYNNISGITEVKAPWQSPIEIPANAFSNATYQGATLFVPGGTMDAYKADDVWSKFLNMEASSYFVTGTATKGGTLAFADLTVTNGTESVLVDRESDVTFTVAPEANYDFTSLTVNGEAVEVEDSTYTYYGLYSDIDVKATFTEKPKFDIKATATGGTVSLNGANFSASQTIKVYRDTDVTLAIAAAEGYENPKVIVNGQDVTAQLQDNTLTLENIQEAKTIVVTYAKKKFQIAAEPTQNGSITLSKNVVEWGDSFTATFTPATGYDLATATLNGEDVTANLVDGVLTVNNVRENKTVGATFQKQTFAVSISGGGITVSNMQPQYGDNVTVTIDDDPDLTLVTLLVNGQDVTAQVVNGLYVIQNVTGNITIEATFRSTKEFITLTGTYATFSCPQDLNFTGSNLRAYIASGFNKATNQVLLTRVYDVPAGTGIFLVGEPGETYKIAYSESTSYYVNLFVANLQKSTVNATTGNFSNYVFGEQDGDPGFYPIEDKVTLLAQTAYLQLPTSFVAAGVKVNVVFEDDIIDGIEEFRISDEDATIYDLAGRRLNKIQRGINIVNGKKVLVK